MEKDVEKIFNDNILNTPKNNDVIFNIGDIVETRIYQMEYPIDRHSIKNAEKIVKYEVIKKHPSNKYDIKKLDSSGEVETEVDGKYLFKSKV